MICFVLALIVVAVPAVKGFPQKQSDKWLRVITGEESMIDLDKSSLVLEPNQLLHADFRTTFLRDEPIPELPDTRYLTRLDTIQFNVKNEEYRVLKSTLFDPSGKVVLSSQPRNASDWKRTYGGTNSRLYNAAIQLAPFGWWKVKSFRYASGETPQKDDPTELTSLVGTDLSLQLGNVQISNKSCRSPIFEPLTISAEQFLRKLGGPLKSLGVQASKISALMLTCETVSTVVFPEPESLPTLKTKVAPRAVQYTVVKKADPKDFPEQTLILLLAQGKALMLWDGVFLEIERPGNPFLP